MYVCPRCKRKTVRAVNTKLGKHSLLYGRTSAGTDSEVKRSKVKATWLSNAMSVSVPICRLIYECNWVSAVSSFISVQLVRCEPGIRQSYSLLSMKRYVHTAMFFYMRYTVKISVDVYGEFLTEPVPYTFVSWLSA